MTHEKCEEAKKEEYTYDEAVELAGHGRYNQLVLVACSIISNAVALDMFAFGLIIATASCDLQLDIGRIGLLASIPFAGLLFAFPWGYYADTSGRRRALLLSCSVGFVMAALGSLSPNWQTLLVMKLVGCSFSTASFSLTMTFLGECTGNKKRSQYMFIMNSINLFSEAVTFMLAMGILSFSFNIPISWLGISYRPWRLLTLILALPLGIGATMMWFLYESPKFLANIGHNDTALEVLRNIFEINGGRKEEYQVKSITITMDTQEKQTFWKSIIWQTFPIFKPPLLWRTIQLFYLMVICCATNNIFVMWYPTIVNSFFMSLSYSVEEDKSFCDRFVGNLTAAPSETGEWSCNDTMSTNTLYAGIITGCFYTGLNLCISKLATWRRSVLLTVFLVPGVCTVLINLIKEPIVSLILFALVQGTAIGIGVVASYFVDLYSTSYRALVTSLALMTARLGSLSGINIIGVAMTTDCELTFYCCAAFVFKTSKMSEKIHRVPFEDALDMTGFGLYNLLIGSISSFVIIAMAFESLSVSYLVPASACELGTTTAQQGLMAAVPLIGILATSHIWGYLADKHGRRKILRWSLVLGFVTGALAAFSPHWMVFCVLKFLSCASVSGTNALTFTLLGETTPRSKRNMLLLMTSSVYLMCTGIMAITTIPVLPLTFSYYIPYLGINFNSWRLLTIIYSLPCAVASALITYMNESPKFLLNMGLEDEAVAVIRGMYAKNTGKNPEDFPVKSMSLNEEVSSQSKYESLWASIKAQTLPLVKPPLVRNTVLLSFMYALIYFCIHPYIVWLPFIADGFMTSIDKGETGLTICQMLRSAQEYQNDTLLDVIEQPANCSLNHFAMMIVLINGCILGMLNFIMSGLIDCFGRKRLLIAVQIITGAAGICVNFSSLWAVTAFIFVAFIANCLNFAVLTTFSVAIFPTYLKAMAVCLTLMVGRTCAFFGINILKQMLISNCELSFYFFGGLTVAGGLLGLMLPADEPNPKTQKRKCPET